MTSFVRASALAALMAFAICDPGAAQTRAAQTDSVLSERLRIFDYVWTEIRDKYYEPTLNGTDWEGARARHRPRVAAAADDRAFYALLRSMVGELRDAHTRVLDPQQARDRRREQSTSAGAVIYEVEGRPIIFAVRPASPAAQAGLRPGLRVTAVNGVPIAEALAKERAEVGSSSSERATLLLAYRRLVAGEPDEALRLGLLRQDGTPFEVSLPRRALDAAPQFEARRLPSGLAYVRFDGFRAPIARRFREALAEHRDARGLIIDLRSNPGGEAREGLRAVGPLLDERTLVARLATRTGRPPSALLGLVRLPLQMYAGKPGDQLYSGPVVVLVNEATASTSELVAAALQERGRARIVGARTCGCALGILRHRRLGDGGALAISEIGLVTGLGRRIEGDGVLPEVPVAVRLADFAAGRDAALEAAVAELEARR
ncbi:MAG TPA: S41 family peptidase [Allosphingosinicella sp.]